MATIYNWNPFGVALDLTATPGKVTRISASQFTVVINASWATYYSGAKTNYGMTASSGGQTATLNTFGTSSSGGSKSFTGTYSVSGGGASTQTVTVAFRNFNNDTGQSATKNVSFNVSVPAWSSYTITYNSNGGTGAPSAQTKLYGQTVTLSNTEPTMVNHKFKGWGTSPSDTTVAYASGASYSKNASITLYAIWERSYAKPDITALSVFRCASNGTASDSGTYFKIDLTYELYSNSPSVVDVKWTKSGGDSSTKSYSKTGASASISAVLGSGSISTDSSYIVTITIEDNGGNTSVERVVPGSAFAIDFTYGSNGPGVAVGKPAEKSGIFEVALDNEFQGDTVQLGNRYTFATTGTSGAAGYIRMASITITNTSANWPITFIFNRRKALAPMMVHMTLENSTADDSTLASFVYEGDNYDAFLFKSQPLVWDLYVKKANANDTITLQDWYTSTNMAKRISIAFPGDMVSALSEISPYTRATPAKIRGILDYIYPVGSIYISYSHVDPGTMFGGTWVRIENAFLWGCDESGTIGQTGGEKTHLLTVNELPAHTHGSVYSANATGTKNLAWYSTSGDKLTYNTVSTGGGAAHNNMPPYIQVSIWRRTA